MSTRPDAGGWVRPMVARDAAEQHRASTPLELFFDLVFVVAIAQASGRLHHAIARNHAADGIVSFGMVFFAIWWAWMGFTWFASGYDNDDVPYRLVVLVQLTGALMLAAGVAPGFDQGDFRIMASGYVVMRVAMVIQWLRVARNDPSRRTTATRYAVGVGLLQVAWVLLSFVAPRDWTMPGWIVLMLGELTVPVWAAKAGRIPYHYHHVVERYGLFTIIVLGESILAASIAVQAAAQGGSTAADIATVAVGGLLIVFSLWWLYFARPSHDRLERRRDAFFWGYGHMPIFASAAAVGAGIAVAVDHETGHAEISASVAGWAVAVPVAVFLICLWALHLHGGNIQGARRLLKPLFALLILLTPLVGEPVLLTGALTTLLLVILLASPSANE